MLGLDDKSSLLASLIKLAKSDGHVDHHEDMLIKMFAIKLGISGEEFKNIVEHADTIQVVAPKTHDERIEHMYKMLSLMKLDLVAHEEEVKMCRDLGIKLGFSTSDVDKLVDYMKAHVDTPIHLDELKQILHH